MQAPEGERMRLLSVAILRATNELHAPIDRIEVTDKHVICWAGLRKITMTYYYAQGGNVEWPSGQFTPMPGSGSWEVVVSDGPANAWPEIIGKALLKVLRRWS
jgi:hypothetical protein